MTQGHIVLKVRISDALLPRVARIAEKYGIKESCALERMVLNVLAMNSPYFVPHGNGYRIITEYAHKHGDTRTCVKWGISAAAMQRIKQACALSGVSMTCIINAIIHIYTIEA